MSRKKDDKTFQRKIAELESLFGQKKTAEKLGVSPSTLRNYKTGKTAPKKDKLQRANRVYGQNKKKITEETFERYQKKVEKKRQVRRKQLVNNPKLQAVSSWVQKEFEEDYIRANIISEAPPFIAPLDGRGQFTDGLSPIGIPKGTKAVTIYGLYMTEYITESDDLSKADYISSRFPILLRKEMNLEQALDYLEGKFFGTTQQAGRRKLNPIRFVGFQL